MSQDLALLGATRIVESFRVEFGALLENATRGIDLLKEPEWSSLSTPVDDTYMICEQ